MLINWIDCFDQPAYEEVFKNVSLIFPFWVTQAWLLYELYLCLAVAASRSDTRLHPTTTATGPVRPSIFVMFKIHLVQKPMSILNKDDCRMLSQAPAHSFSQPHRAGKPGSKRSGCKIMQ